MRKNETKFRALCIAFSSPEAVLVLVSTKNRDLWLAYRSNNGSPRFTDFPSLWHAQSQVWQIWLVLVSIYCVYKSIQNRNVVGPDQRSRFLMLTKRSAASGDENVCIVNGGCLETLNSLRERICKIFTFCDVLHETNTWNKYMKQNEKTQTCTNSLECAVRTGNHP